MTTIAPTQVENRFSGSWLWVSRFVWIFVFLLSTVTFAYSLPFHYRLLATPCTGVACDQAQPTIEFTQGLAALGLSVQWYASWYMIILSTVALAYCAFATLLIWRSPEDRSVWLFSLILVIIGTFLTPTVDALAQINLAWQYYINIMNSVMWMSFALLFYIFPDGRFVPSWSWLALLPLVSLRVAAMLPASFPLAKTNWPPYVEPIIVLIIFGTCIYAQVYRYRRVSNPLQRQQTKWIVFGLLLIALLLCVVSLGIDDSPTTYTSVLDIVLEFVGVFIALLVYLTLPFTMTLAILRYRLWDIDILIRRTLVYSVLSVTLALIYFGCVFLLQTIVHRFTGSVSQLAVVGSTLTIAALFQPLRRWIQALIDRRFYRRKYDAEHVLAAFSTTVRNEVELDRLAQQLLTIVEETLQPEKVSVWLRQPPTRIKRLVDELQ